MGLGNDIKKGVAAVALSAGLAFSANAQETGEEPRSPDTEMTQEVDLSKIPAQQVKLTINGVPIAGRDFGRAMLSYGIKNGQDAVDFAEGLIEKMETGKYPLPRGLSDAEGNDQENNVKIEIINNRQSVQTVYRTHKIEDGPKPGGNTPQP